MPIIEWSEKAWKPFNLVSGLHAIFVVVMQMDVRRVLACVKGGRQGCNHEKSYAST